MGQNPGGANNSSDDENDQGDTWYLVQSKYGSAFSGRPTLLIEAQKVIETLDGRRQALSSLTSEVLERIRNFMARRSDRDRLTLVFATVDPLSADERKVLQDIEAMGRSRLGPAFEVKEVSLATIYDQAGEETSKSTSISVSLKAHLTDSDKGLLVGTAKLLDPYAFLRDYRVAVGGDLDQLYEKNVRLFLGSKSKVNREIQRTLENEPQSFGLFDNGITFVVESLNQDGDRFELVEPYVVNGCQTTKSIWDVLYKKLESGGTGNDPDLTEWKSKLDAGSAIVKIVRIGPGGEALLTEITRFTNSQNAIGEKDFLALTEDFRLWAHQMAERYGIFLEIQRGGWDSQKALQHHNRSIRQFDKVANAFDLLKVYAAAWLGEAGMAFSKSAPFAPSGIVFKRIVNRDPSEEPFGLDDLYGSYLLQEAAKGFGFGRGAQVSRRLTRYMFYVTAVELLKDVMIDCRIDRTLSNITRALLRALENDGARSALLETSIQLIDEYVSQNSPDSVFAEPPFAEKYGGSLNAFLKWEEFGKSDRATPLYRRLLVDYHRTVSRGTAGQTPRFAPLMEVVSEMKDAK